MKIQIKKDRKTAMIIVVALFLCLIAAGIFAISANSDGRKLSRQLELGQKYLDELDYEQAVVAFTNAIEIDPMNVDAYLGMAEAYVGLDDVERAVEVLEQGYELTGDEEIQRKLEELRESMTEAESAEVENGLTGEGILSENGTVQEEEGLPYYELGFSPEDFTIAGYSVMDGNHLDDIEQAAAAIMPYYHDADPEQREWTWDKDDGIVIYIEYEHNMDHAGRYGCNMRYDMYQGRFPELSVYYFENVDEIPLYEGKLPPYVISYEETLDILGIAQLLQMVDEEGLSYEFESQYGKSACRNCGGRDDNVFDQSYGISTESFNLWLYFSDNVLWSYSIG